MPHLFDTIEQPILPALQDTLALAPHADFCVGYFNLRAWRELAPLLKTWPGGPEAEPL